MFTDSITPEALALLKRLMAQATLEQFRLVGGTALALLRGHRLSVDLDFFIHARELPPQLEELLTGQFQANSLKVGDGRAVISGFVDQVKVDFVAYPYPWLEEAQLYDGIRISAFSDIAAMKVSAIGQRGSKKDFFDLAELLTLFPLSRIMEYFRGKFPTAADLHYLQSLVYFEDAEGDPDPILNKRSLTWDAVKQKILEAVRLSS